MVDDQELCMEGFRAAAKLVGLDLAPRDLEALLPLVREQMRQSRTLGSLEVGKDVEPDIVFRLEAT